MPHHEENNFSGVPEVHDFDALLFDMDGTIIDSTPAIVKHWHQLGREIGVPGDEILETSHGRRSIDVLAILAPHLANWEYVCKAEGAIPINYGQDATEVPGNHPLLNVSDTNVGRALLEHLEVAKAPWAIVTSGTKPLVSGWLDVMKLAHPQFMVTAEEVKQGKPDPACYRLGAERLGVKSSNILVLEDAPAGVMSGKAAGYRVIALATTHSIEKLKQAGADWIVRDMESVTLSRFDVKTGKISIQVNNSLVV